MRVRRSSGITAWNWAEDSTFHGYHKVIEPHGPSMESESLAAVPTVGEYMREVLDSDHSLRQSSR